MTTTTDEQLHHTILHTANVDTRSLDFGTIDDQYAGPVERDAAASVAEDAVARDVQRIRSSPFLGDDLAISGGIYDLDTGLIEILTSA